MITPKRKRKSREELNELGRQQQKQRKHKGLPAGWRSNNKKEVPNIIVKNVVDSRIGSKVLVPLIVSSALIETSVVSDNKIRQWEKELLELEDNVHLNTLLDRLDLGEQLSAAENKQVTNYLDRIDKLITLLGIDPDDGAEYTD